MESPEPEMWSENASLTNVTGNVTGDDAARPRGGILVSFAIAQPFIYFFMFFRSVFVGL